VNLSLIVSPVDFSVAGEAALGRALALARWHDSDLHVLYVQPGRAGQGASGATSADDPYLGRLAKFISSSNSEGVAVTPVVITGDPVSAVADYARVNAADLVIVGQNGRRGSRFWRSGVLATDLARAVESPTLTVSKESNSSADAAASFNNILVAIDFSPASLRALNQALTLAQQSGGRVTLLHVMEGVPYETVYSGSRASQLIGEYRVRVDKVKHQLRALIPPDALNWIEVEVKVVSGVPHEAIVTTASERNADLVVIGRTRRSRLDRIVMASTVAGVLRRARSLVLIVPEPSDVADVESKVIGADRHDDEAIALFTPWETDRQADYSQRGVELV
jgi:nucleotide-binding universal stress UspA family protein